MDGLGGSTHTPTIHPARSHHRNLACRLRYSPVETIQSLKWAFPALTLPGSVRFSPAAMKDIRHTVRYTELSPARFKGLWKD
jgi:hypothetical protein